MTNATKDKTTKVSGPSLASLVPFEQVCEPGAYVCNWNGHLMRVPPDAISSSHCPTINIVGPEPLFVTKISDDPFVTLTKARMLACNFDINVCF